MGLRASRTSCLLEVIFPPGKNTYSRSLGTKWRRDACTRRRVLLPHPRMASPSNRRGLTLYEVFLALALLLGAMAVLSQHIGVGTRAGIRARLQTQAAFHCESKLAEVIAGVEPMTAVSEQEIANAGDGWSWSLEVAPGPQPDLLNLSVSVSHVNSTGDRDAFFTLRRLTRDPQMFLDAAANASSSSGSSGSTY